MNTWIARTLVINSMNNINTSRSILCQLEIAGLFMLLLDATSYNSNTNIN